MLTQYVTLALRRVPRIFICIYIYPHARVIFNTRTSQLLLTRPQNSVSLDLKLSKTVLWLRKNFSLLAKPVIISVNSTVRAMMSFFFLLGMMISAWFKKQTTTTTTNTSVYPRHQLPCTCSYHLSASASGRIA